MRVSKASHRDQGRCKSWNWSGEDTNKGKKTSVTAASQISITSGVQHVDRQSKMSTITETDLPWLPSRD